MYVGDSLHLCLINSKIYIFTSKFTSKIHEFPLVFVNIPHIEHHSSYSLLLNLFLAASIKLLKLLVWVSGKPAVSFWYFLDVSISVLL